MASKTLDIRKCECWGKVFLWKLARKAELATKKTRSLKRLEILLSEKQTVGKMQPFSDKKPAATTQLNLFRQKNCNIDQSTLRTTPQLSRLKLWTLQRQGVGLFKTRLMPPRIKLATFCVLGRRDNRYTTALVRGLQNIGQKKLWVVRKGNSLKTGVESWISHQKYQESQTARDSVFPKNKL